MTREEEIPQKLLGEICNYFGSIIDMTEGISPQYYAAKFISQSYNIDDLKIKFEKLKNPIENADDLESSIFEMSNTEKAYKGIYKSKYTGYICCPYCGNTKVPLTSHICTMCSAGLA